ncbi:putative CENP-V/GFA domain, Mss4-like superfamily protein [Septoria linicola]|nr:putative CENP-V/GFA domain, Mss4-like superfamily protein [Septoria linicola]
MADQAPATFTATENNTYTGACLCGSITLRLSLPYDLYARPQGHICHCNNCRKTSSAAAGAAVIMLPTSQIELSDPDKELKTYNDTSSKSGRTVPRSFCGECGSPVGCVPTDMLPELSVVALGLFVKMPEPVFECFVKRRGAWVKPTVEEAKQYEYVDEIGGYGGSVLAGEGYGV